MDNIPIKICMIAGIAANRVIGNNNELIWHISEDLKWFRKNTSGKPVIMGRKTFKSIGRLLPKRLNIIISRQDGFSLPDFPEAKTASSLEDALKIAKADALKNNEEEIFIIGGAQIYALGFPLADRLYLTHIEQSYNGDTLFPEFDQNEWVISFNEKHNAEKNTPAFSFSIYERK